MIDRVTDASSKPDGSTRVSGSVDGTNGVHGPRILGEGTRDPGANGALLNSTGGRDSRDQAHGLRVLAAQRRAFDPSRRLAQSTRVIAVTSGKGGVGKTHVVVNLAILLARWGKSVIILDCDFGTANVDVMLGMHPRYSLQHVLSRQRRLDEVMVTGPAGIRVIPGGSGLHELANLSDGRREELLSLFSTLDGQADVLLLDTGAGISANVLRFVVAAGEAIVVTTPEPTAVTDAYALIKVASQQVNPGGGTAETLKLRLLVNQALDESEARETSSNIATVARRFLNVDVEPFGIIPADPLVGRAVRGQVPVVEAFPKAPASLAFARVARALLADAPAGRSEEAQAGSDPVRETEKPVGSLGMFMHRVLSFARGKVS